MLIPSEQFGNKYQIDSPAGTKAPLDWPGLVVRLTAAQFLRQVLVDQPDHQLDQHCGPSGSFAPAWAPFVAAHLRIADRQVAGYASNDVNQIPKADGKHPAAIAENSRGEDPMPLRGL